MEILAFYKNIDIFALIQKDIKTLFIYDNKYRNRKCISS